MHQISRAAPKKKPFTVVLSGGIASGKTTVSNEFSALGIQIIDTDMIARELVTPGKEALNEIRAVFGNHIIQSGGTLDRRKLRGIVFSDRYARKRLESILHPAIEKQVLFQLSNLNVESYCVVVVPLLAESTSYKWAERILIVDIPTELQLARVMARDNTSEMEAQAVISAQASREERLALADDVIENSGSLEDLRRNVQILHEKYLTLAERKTRMTPTN